MYRFIHQSLIVSVLILTSPLVISAPGNSCPDGLAENLSKEFGPGVAEKTQCVKEKKDIKVVMQVNQYCGKKVDGKCIAPHGFRTIPAMIKNYTITNGIPRDQVDIVMVVHGGGGKILLKGSQFETQVRFALDNGVKVYFCQETLRSFIKKGLIPAGKASESLIEGVEYVTGGLLAVVDFQKQGYKYIQP